MKAPRRYSILSSGPTGFTLIELMVVVTIVGLITSIAIPQYQRFATRARQTEAKVGLGGIYSTLKAFQIANDSYSACLQNIGYDPTLAAKRFYTLGFPGGFGAMSLLCGPTGTSRCDQFGWSGPDMSCTNAAGAIFVGEGSEYFSANQGAWAPFPTHAALVPNAALAQTVFTVGAVGNVTHGMTDVWTINELKTLTNTQPGI